MDTKEKVINLVSKITQLEETVLEGFITKEKPWDSFQNVEIIFALEEEFGIMFSQEEIAQLTTLANLIKIVKGHLDAA